MNHVMTEGPVFPGVDTERMRELAEQVHIAFQNRIHCTYANEATSEQLARTEESVAGIQAMKQLQQTENPNLFLGYHPFPPHYVYVRSPEEYEVLLWLAYDIIGMYAHIQNLDERREAVRSLVEKVHAHEVAHFTAGEGVQGLDRYLMLGFFEDPQAGVFGFVPEVGLRGEVKLSDLKRIIASPEDLSQPDQLMLAS